MISFFENLIHTFVSFAKIVIQSKFKTDIPKTSYNTCIVLGNGASFSISSAKYEKEIKQHPLICVNSFSLTKEYIQLQPMYYVILDYSFWKSDSKVLANTLNAIAEHTSWKLHLFVPQLARSSGRFEQLYKQNSNIQLHYFNYTVFKGFEGVAKFFYKNNLAMPQSQNVLVASLFLAVNMGFKNIYLLGADHNWHQTLHLGDDNVLSLKHIHFYDNEEKVDYVPFYKGAHTKEVFTIQEIFTTWAKVFKGYKAVDSYAKGRNASIYNASEVSFIDAFERKKLNEV